MLSVSLYFLQQKLFRGRVYCSAPQVDLMEVCLHLQVKFDDNNPFSEGFQERERRERLREQQERQRVQLMHEVKQRTVSTIERAVRPDTPVNLFSFCFQVERHRALQQRLELEQQSLLGASMGSGAGVATMPPAGALPGTRVSQAPASGGPAGPVQPATAPGGDSLSQMPFFSSELPQDFLQSPPASRPPPQHQAGPPFPQQDFTGPLHPGVHPGPLPGSAAERGRALPEHGPLIDVASSNLQTRPRPPGPSAQGLVRPSGVAAAGMTPSHPGGHRFGHDSSSSSPSTPLAPSFPCSSSGAPTSLMQLYSDILPDDKPKKKRSRKKDGDSAMEGGGSRTPLSSHSDDMTAPPTPAFSDTSCSTPTRGIDQSDMLFPQSSGLAPSLELERQLSVSAAAQQRASVPGMEFQKDTLTAARLKVKVRVVFKPVTIL